MLAARNFLQALSSYDKWHNDINTSHRQSHFQNYIKYIDITKLQWIISGKSKMLAVRNFLQVLSRYDKWYYNDINISHHKAIFKFIYIYKFNSICCFFTLDFDKRDVLQRLYELYTWRSKTFTHFYTTYQCLSFNFA